MPDDTITAWNPNEGLTLFGRKPALEALMDPRLNIYCLHLASSNRQAGIIAQIHAEAEKRGVTIRYHDRQALSRISKNGRQDQGVALDVVCPQFRSMPSLLEDADPPRALLALDGVTNPQNVGMVIRSAVAAGVGGIIYPKRGIASLGPLVIKASAGTLFRAPIIRCETTFSAVANLQSAGYRVATLHAEAPTSLFEDRCDQPTVFVLGSETEGISAALHSLADRQLSIPMTNDVESLNVAVTAALVAFHLQSVSTRPTSQKP